MSDFETASRNAIKYHFPNITLKGCWFHYRQAIFRKAVKIGIKKSYHLDEYRDFLNLFGALALIPASKVIEGFDIIINLMPNDPKCDELCKYFEKEWIKSKSKFKKNINFKM